MGRGVIFDVGREVGSVSFEVAHRVVAAAICTTTT
jgi:predicted amidohydrolase